METEKIEPGQGDDGVGGKLSEGTSLWLFALAENYSFHTHNFIFTFNLYVVELVQSPAMCQHFH